MHSLAQYTEIVLTPLSVSELDSGLTLEVELRTEKEQGTLDTRIVAPAKIRNIVHQSIRMTRCFTVCLTITITSFSL